MSETNNTAEIAKRIVADIFGVFFWELRPIEDTNFECVMSTHRTPKDKQKLTHPCDVLFHYVDPYLNKTIYLHTDLKSYGKSTLKQKDIRGTLNSLALTLECAHRSESWQKKYPADTSESYEIRGLLLVTNHDNKAPVDFTEQLAKISKTNLDIAKSQIIHVISPRQISDFFSIATDIKLSISAKTLSARYRFFYPDLTLWKRKTADDVRNAATIETLMSPYFVIKHDGIKEDENTILVAGSLIYYSRNGDTVEEFVYLLDSLLRYQLVKANEQIRIKIFSSAKSQYYKQNFEQAKLDYCKTWGFEHTREQEIRAISIDSINQIATNYTPDEIGWKDR